MIQILDCYEKYVKKGNGPTIPTVCLVGKDMDGEVHTLSLDHHRPFFFALGTLPKGFKERYEILSVENVNKFLPIGYQVTKTKMYKITVYSPGSVARLRDELKDMQVFEADILYKYRYLIDHHLGGMQWTENGMSPVENEQNAPLRSVAIDIEVLPPESGKFPTWLSDRIIIISMAFSDGTLEVITNDNEKRLLEDFIERFNAYDPDIIVTYNGDGFDWEYIVKRCEHHRVELTLGREGSVPETRGSTENPYYYIKGRVSIDMLPLIRKNYSLKNYKLGTVASLVHQQKLDVNAKEISGLWQKNDPKLFEYAKQDANITLKLLLELKILEKYIALCKASGLLLQDCVYGGQSGMIETLLLKEFKKDDRVLPIKHREKNRDRQKGAVDKFGENETITLHSFGGLDPLEFGEIVERLKDEDDDDILYEGATVLDPPKGLHENIIVLDYKSLYPTIVISHNLSYDTLIVDNGAPVFHGDYETSPVEGNPRFVKPHLRKGIMPRILEDLLDQRLKTKKQMKSTKDELELSLLDAKQYAFKILLNSFYGYAGYRHSRLFTLDVAASVTAYGRINIEDTQQVVRNMGYEVLYGDTDSIFVKVNTSQFDEATEIGKKIAKAATDRLPPPMELVFEAYVKRVLFLAKKRYGMFKFEEKGKGKIKAKGIETVRRDWCDYTSENLSEIIRIILEEGDVNKALQVARNAISRIKQKDISAIYTKLVLSKRLGNSYKSGVEKNLPHTILRDKMRKRGIIDYQVGDRVEYVIVKGTSDFTSEKWSDDHRVKYSQKAEDPAYAIQHNIELDIDYYVKKQLINPFMRIFSTLGYTSEDLINDNVRTKSKKMTLGDFV